MGIALSGFSSPAGVKLPAGTFVAPGTEIFYVHATPSYFPPELAGYIDTTIELAMAKRSANTPGAIFVLPGHTQNITAATTWSKARTQIIFLGDGDDRGVITFTAAASAITMSGAGIFLKNARLQLEPTTGTVTVAAPFTITGAGCGMVGNTIYTGTDANNKVTIGVTVTSAARFQFRDNIVRGAALATMTTFLRLNAATDAVITGNDIVCGTTSAAVGPIQMLTTLSTGVRIQGNQIQNNAASSTACITGMANSTGWISDNYLRNMTDASNAQIVATSAIWQEFENYGVNNVAERGIILGTASV